MSHGFTNGREDLRIISTLLHALHVPCLPPFRAPFQQKNSTIETAQSLLPAAQAAYDASLVPLRAAIATAQSSVNAAYNNWQAAEADRAAYKDQLWQDVEVKLDM